MYKKFISAFLSLAFLLSPLFVEAKTAAKVKGKVITHEMLKAAHKKSPKEVSAAPFSKAYPMLRDQEVLKEVINAARPDMSSDEEVIKLLSEAKKAIELQVFLKREVEKRITDKDIDDLYSQISEKMKGQKEMQVGLIVLNDLASAKKVVNDLKAGKDFSELARKNSIEPTTKKSGGDLGYLLETTISTVFGPDALSAIKILKPNVYTKEPIKSKEGKYLVLRRGDSRTAVVPPKDKMMDQLKAILSQKALSEFIKELVEKAKPQVFDEAGNETEMQMLQNPATGN